MNFLSYYNKKINFDHLSNCHAAQYAVNSISNNCIMSFFKDSLDEVVYIRYLNPSINTILSPVMMVVTWN